jgi:hypothetical protein
MHSLPECVNIPEHSMNPLRQIRSCISIIVLNLARIQVPGLKTMLLLLCFATLLTLTTRIMLAADTASQRGTANVQQTASGQAPEPEAHGISQKAIEVARLRNFPITNSMILSWVVALGLILFAQLTTRNTQQVPSGAQNFLEWIVEGLYNFLAGIIGPTWWTGRSGFLQRSLSSFSPPIGWDSFQG